MDIQKYFIKEIKKVEMPISVALIGLGPHAKKPEFINSYGSRKFEYWLKTVASNWYFVVIYAYGHANTYGASALVGVRPRFLID